jgi:Flp pilus assembly CpaE family ATPase
LKVLFGPQTASECREIGPAHAAAISKALAGIADYVVVDLPASLSEANRAVIEKSGFLALVVERDPMCVESARRMVRAIASWTVPPQQIDTVIVSRVSLRFPMSLPEIGNELGGPALGVIPSEPDLCQSAQNARTPLVAFLPESQIAGSLVALAERLASGRQWQAGAK